MSEKNLDKFFRDKLADRNFEYEDAYWQDALELIDAEDKGSNVWAYVAIGALCIFLIGAIVWNSSSSNNTNAEQPKQPTALNEKKEDQENIIDNTFDNTINPNTEKENTNQLLKSHSFKNEPLASAKQSPMRAEANEPVINQLSENVAQSASENAIAESSNAADLTIPQTINIANNRPKSLEENKVGKDVVLKKSETYENQGSNSQGGENYLENQASQPENEAEASFNLNSDRISIAELSFIENRFGVVNKKVDNISIDIAPNPAKSVRRLSFGVAAMVNPYLETNDGDENIAGYSLGAQIGYKLTNNLTLDVGAYYSNQKGSFTESYLQEDFGTRFFANDTKIVKSYTPSALHYIDIPITIGLQTGNSSIDLGLSVRSLINVQGSLQQELYKNDVLQELDSYNATGTIVKDGFTKMNIAGVLGYRRFFSKNAAFQFRLNYFFRNPVDQSQVEQINRPILKENSRIGVQIGAAFYLR